MIHYSADGFSTLCNPGQMPREPFSGWTSKVTCKECRNHADCPPEGTNEVLDIALDEIARARELVTSAGKDIEALGPNVLPEWKRKATLNLVYMATSALEEAEDWLEDEA